MGAGTDTDKYDAILAHKLSTESVVIFPAVSPKLFSQLDVCVIFECFWVVWAACCEATAVEYPSSPNSRLFGRSNKVFLTNPALSSAPDVRKLRHTIASLFGQGLFHRYLRLFGQSLSSFGHIFEFIRQGALHEPHICIYSAGASMQC